LIPVLPKNVQVKRKPMPLNMQYFVGSDARLIHLAENITLLMKYERLEMKYHVAVELRAYAERLIASAVRYGDCHMPTMELTSFWLRVCIIHYLILN